MANNYLQFSFAVGPLSEECCDWVRGLLSQADQDEPSDDFRSIFAEGDEFEWDDFEDLGFQWDLGKESDSLWIYAEESGDVDMVVAFLKVLVAWGDPCLDEAGFTYSQTCSSPRLDQFCGGAVLVRMTDDGPVCEYMNAGQWLSDRVALWSGKD